MVNWSIEDKAWDPEDYEHRILKGINMKQKPDVFRLLTWMWTANADCLLSVTLFYIITIIFSTLELNDATKQKLRKKLSKVTSCTKQKIFFRLIRIQ